MGLERRLIAGRRPALPARSAITGGLPASSKPGNRGFRLSPRRGWRAVDTPRRCRIARAALLDRHGGVVSERPSYAGRPPLPLDGRSVDDDAAIGRFGELPEALLPHAVMGADRAAVPRRASPVSRHPVPQFAVGASADGAASACGFALPSARGGRTDSQPPRPVARGWQAAGSPVTWRIRGESDAA